MWRASILTLFPEMFPGPLGVSLAGKALASGAWALDVTDIRDFATDKHRSVDDTPAGGGPGMVMKADVLGRAIDAAAQDTAQDTRPRLLMSPRGPSVPAPSWSAAASKASTSASSPRVGWKRFRSAIMCCPAARSRRWR